MYFNQKFAHPYYSSWNSVNINTLSYSVEYLTRIIFCESVLGVSHMLYAKDFAHFGRKSNSKSRWSLKKKDTRLTVDFTWPAIFAVSIKTQLYGYFYGNNKIPAILVTLVLILLLRILSIIEGIVIHNALKRQRQFQSISIIVWLSNPSLTRLEYLLDYGSTFVQAPLYSEKSGITALTFKPLAF